MVNSMIYGVTPLGMASEMKLPPSFGFLHEIESLQKAGLALGGSLENAIVLDQYRVVNETGLRYDDECVRHKILDTLGDLSLAGLPIIGAFEGERTGHEMNHKLVTTLLADPSAWRIEELKAEIGIAISIKEYGIKEVEFLSVVDELAVDAFDDQCTGANPRYPLISELKELYLKAFYGKDYASK